MNFLLSHNLLNKTVRFIESVKFYKNKKIGLVNTTQYKVKGI
ncbi:hypothetical protein MEG_00622 [Bartonella tamiae Th307]|uniref:Uncharacterized protein n=1 Tax=Bartonella tamiae Th239 TaxID=1094558 RepID=J0QZN3_9HYPH|nr:hypothetical protein ME5_01260 [Bartonella tamiae Th239]EJF95041.1 hypothetical protein MEG_00622 [Bartonella tamiae Th307]